MKKYEAYITPSALQDMQSIYEYIANTFNAPETAMQQYNRIAEKIESLETLPERHQEYFLDNYGYRKILVDNYTVFYTVSDTAVTVFTVLYSSSDLTERLKNFIL